MIDRDALDDDSAAPPLRPTGSGPADLEVAFEQMKLSAAADPTPGAADPEPVAGNGDEAEGEAHPS